MKTKKLKFSIFIGIWILICITVIPSLGQQLKINSGAWLNNQGTVYLKINNADLVIDGNYTKGTETIVLSGNTAGLITGNANANIYNLSLSNTEGVSSQLGILSTNSINIELNSKLSIDPNKVVIVTSTLSNNAGNAGLVLQSDATGSASLLHNTNNVPATVKRYISGSAESWHFLSTPVSDQSISGDWLPPGTYGNGSGYDLYLWNEPSNCWIYRLDSTSIINWKNVHTETNFVVGRGYLYSLQSLNPTKDFTGNLNNGTVNYDITISSPDATLKGFNLIGNPYPSSVDWGASTGWTRNILKSTVGGYNMWIWNPTANNYGVCNSATGIGTNNITRYIAPMQGFYIQDSIAGYISTTNDVRIQEPANNWLIISNNVVSLSLIVTSEAGYGYDEVQFNYGGLYTEKGARKLFSHMISAPSLYLTSDGNCLSSVYFTNIEENPVAPIMFRPGADGKYSIKCSYDASKFKMLILEDTFLNFIHDLKENNSYEFRALKGDNENRFVLYFGPVANTSNGELPARIYANGCNLFVDLVLVSEETDVLIYDILGRILFQQKLSGKIQHKLDFATNDQSLLIFLRNHNGVYFKKIIWMCE